MPSFSHRGNQRGGRVRSFYMPHLGKPDIHDAVRNNVSPKAHLRTDEWGAYHGIGKLVASHKTVHHGNEEWRRGDASTNTIEGVFSVFKRGMVGVYQHCEVQHLQRYLHEFDFRYSNRKALGIEDEGRSVKALKGASGKRLTYRTTRGQESRA